MSGVVGNGDFDELGRRRCPDEMNLKPSLLCLLFLCGKFLRKALLAKVAKGVVRMTC